MEAAFRYGFGRFALDGAEGVLYRDGAPVHLTPRAVGVLLALVERHGELVTKEALFARVWSGLAVEECNLAQHVAALRRTLGDTANQPLFIETVPRRGYRFTARVARVPRTPEAPLELDPPRAAPVSEALEPPAPAPTAAPRGARSPRGRRAVLAAVAGAVLLAVLGGVRARSLAAGRRLTVLPVANLTGDPRQAHLAEVLSDVLLTDLRGVKGLVVESRAHPEAESLADPGGRHAPAADGVVEVALLGAGERVQVAVELIEPRSDTLVWGDVIEAEADGLLDLERRMADGILERLQLSGGQRLRAGAGAAAARREHALARYYVGRRTPQVVEEALEHFTTAVRLDPSLARAHAGLAGAYLLAAAQRVSPAREVLRRAEAAAARALELEPALAEALTAAGAVAEARADVRAAEAHYRRALRADPLHAEAHERYARLLSALGRHEEALGEAAEARRLDPDGVGAGLALTTVAYRAGRHEQAEREATALVRHFPQHPEAHAALGRAYQAQGRRAEAIAALREAARFSDENPLHLAALARAIALDGGHGEARQLLARIEATAPAWRSSPEDAAQVLAALGEPERAHEALARAAEAEAPWLLERVAPPELPELRGDGRLAALTERLVAGSGGAGAASTEPACGEEAKPPGRSPLAPAPGVRTQLGPLAADPCRRGRLLPAAWTEPAGGASTGLEPPARAEGR